MRLAFVEQDSWTGQHLLGLPVSQDAPAVFQPPQVWISSKVSLCTCSFISGFKHCWFLNQIQSVWDTNVNEKLGSFVSGAFRDSSPSFPRLGFCFHSSNAGMKTVQRCSGRQFLFESGTRWGFLGVTVMRHEAQTESSLSNKQSHFGKTQRNRFLVTKRWWKFSASVTESRRVTFLTLSTVWLLSSRLLSWRSDGKPARASAAEQGCVLSPPSHFTSVTFDAESKQTPTVAPIPVCLERWKEGRGGLPQVSLEGAKTLTPLSLPFGERIAVLLEQTLRPAGGGAAERHFLLRQLSAL